MSGLLWFVVCLFSWSFQQTAAGLRESALANRLFYCRLDDWKLLIKELIGFQLWTISHKLKVPPFLTETRLL